VCIISNAHILYCEPIDFSQQQGDGNMGAGWGNILSKWPLFGENPYLGRLLNEPCNKLY
jgi:hypothetical protein